MHLKKMKVKINLQLLIDILTCKSITPEDDGAINTLSCYLHKLHFTCLEKTFGEGPEAVKNLYAYLVKNSHKKHFCFAGHTDVVPTGPLEAWTYQPFSATIKNGIIFGRGSQDMKGAIIAFIAALEAFLKSGQDFGTISFLITGDEEQVAKYGTKPMIEFLYSQGVRIDSVLVGEPVSKKKLGDNIKIGARGSATFAIMIQGKQGHVAYEGQTKNPVKDLNKFLTLLYNYPFENKNPLFSPTNLEVTKIDCDSGADNIVPDRLLLKFNFRYGEDYNYEKLKELVTEIARNTLEDYEITSITSGDAALWLSENSDFLKLTSSSLEKVTGIKPEITTYGGTSDARFIRHYCEALEVGVVGDKAHQIDESVSIAELHSLAEIYLNILIEYFA